MLWLWYIGDSPNIFLNIGLCDVLKQRFYKKSDYNQACNSKSVVTLSFSPYGSLQTTLVAMACWIFAWIWQWCQKSNGKAVKILD